MTDSEFDRRLREEYRAAAEKWKPEDHLLRLVKERKDALQAGRPSRTRRMLSAALAACLLLTVAAVAMRQAPPAAGPEAAGMALAAQEEGTPQAAQDAPALAAGPQAFSTDSAEEDGLLKARGTPAQDTPAAPAAGEETAPDLAQASPAIPTLQATEVTPTGMTVAYCANGVGEAYCGSGYWLEVWQNSQWQAVEPVADEVMFDSLGWILPAEREYSWHTDWTAIYGTLPAGSYRYGKAVTVSGASGNAASYDCFAYFDIENSGG